MSRKYIVNTSECADRYMQWLNITAGLLIRAIAAYMGR